MEGFLEEIKTFGRLLFVTLRLLPQKGQIKRVQFVAKDPSLIQQIEQTPRQSYVICEGALEPEQKSKISSYVLQSFVPINKAVLTPQVLLSKAQVSKISPFYLKNPSTQKLFFLKSLCYKTIRQFLDQKGFVQVMTPKLVNFGSEGGSEIFEVTGKHLTQNLYLTQSPQIFKQLAVNSGLEKFYQIGPIYRAQKFKTTRHANEAVCLDVEQKTTSLKSLLLLIRELILSISSQLNKIEPESIVLDKEDFRVISYAKAIKLLKTSCLETSGQFQLVKLCKKPFLFVVGYPSSLRTFYTYKRYSFDLLSSKAQLCSGSVRQKDCHRLSKNLRSRGMSQISLAPYLQSFKTGSVWSMGFGMGLDRLLMVLLNKISISNTDPWDSFKP